MVAPTRASSPVRTPAPAPRPPSRTLLRLAGVLTQIGCGACLLIGTIGLVLVQQNTAGSIAPMAGWLVLAMTGLVFGGLIYRGGLVNLIVTAVIDAGFGVALVVLDGETVRALLGILPVSDVDAIARVLAVTGYAMIAIGALCLAVLPHGVRYARWFRDAAATRTAMSMARGAGPVRGSAYILPADAAPGSRRRLYMMLGGLAVGVGAGFGALVSSTGPIIELPPSPGSSAPEPARALHAAPAATSDATVVPEPGPAIDGVQQLLAAEHAALGAVDRRALAELVIPAAFGFGVEAVEVAEGRDRVVAQLVHDLGSPPRGGFTVRASSLELGEQRDHAWISEELEVSAAGGEPRRFAVSELAARIAGRWQFVALHWATPIDDETAERLAILHRLPAVAPIDNRHDGDDSLDRAVRAAFAGRAAFVDARSERGDAFNLGSGGERARGGVAIKRLFTKLKSQVRLHDGARVVAGSAWDPAQQPDAWIGWAAFNVDFTSQTRAATELTQTFRVLAIVVKEGGVWKLVQTQWSNGGPIHS